MKILDDLHYTGTHEWVRIEDGRAKIGVTDYAQEQLHEIVYVDFPEIGPFFRKGEVLGALESTKTASDILSPITGKVVEINLTLKESPQFINEDPYGKGWILKMEILHPEEFATLLSPIDYRSSLKETS